MKDIFLLLSFINVALSFHKFPSFQTPIRMRSRKYSSPGSSNIFQSYNTYSGQYSSNPPVNFPSSHLFSSNQNIRPTITDRARTIANTCNTGTLCTTSSKEDIEGIPFGSYVDYILNEQGWPIVLLNNMAVHSQNIEHSKKVSLYIQLPTMPYTQTLAAISRVTILGNIEPVPQDEQNAMKFAFLLIHPHTEGIIDSNKFQLQQIKPSKIFFAGGFGVSSDWVSVADYEVARPDVIAHEVGSILSRVNIDKQQELALMCRYFLQITELDQVRIQSIDRLGIDLRVKKGKHYCVQPIILACGGCLIYFLLLGCM